MTVYCEKTRDKATGKAEAISRETWDWGPEEVGGVRCLGTPCGLTVTWEHTIAPNEAWPPLAVLIGPGYTEGTMVVREKRRDRSVLLRHHRGGSRGDDLVVLRPEISHLSHGSLTEAWRQLKCSVYRLVFEL